VTTGELLRAAREKVGISQAKLASLTGMHRQQLYRYEKGINEPELPQLRLLARALGVEPGELIGRDG